MFNKRKKRVPSAEDIFDQILRNSSSSRMKIMTADHAELLPWISFFSIFSLIDQGGLPKSPEKAAIKLLSEAEDALVRCVDNPEGQKLAIATVGQTLKDPLKTQALPLFEAIAAGANEIGKDDEGIHLLLAKTMPAAIDGLQKFSNEPVELSRHVTIWFILALAGGTSTERLDLDQHKLIQQVLPPMVIE